MVDGRFEKEKNRDLLSYDTDKNRSGLESKMVLSHLGDPRPSSFSYFKHNF
jgi:hypothetical protein